MLCPRFSLVMATCTGVSSARSLCSDGELTKLRRLLEDLRSVVRHTLRVSEDFGKVGLSL